MELLCIFLNCTPNDLYNFVPDSERQVAPEHMLMSIRKRKAVYDPAEYIKLLRPEQIEAANEYLKKNGEHKQSCSLNKKHLESKRGLRSL